MLFSHVSPRRFVELPWAHIDVFPKGFFQKAFERKSFKGNLAIA
jgi:hypothetical protein